MDLTGQVFNNFAVLEKVYTGKKRGWMWRAVCTVCNSLTLQTPKTLRESKGRCSGCKYTDKRLEPGSTHGEWEVIGYEDSGFYLCKCKACGIRRLVEGSSLKNGRSKSCGQHKQKKVIRYKAPPTMSIWGGMIDRCTNPNSKAYHNYGGRGIYVCDEWKIFSNFNDWALQNNYQKGLEIDRKDNDGPYSPENCHFVTIKANQNNKRNNHWVEVKGEKMTLTQAVERYGVVSYSCASQRIRKSGCDVWEALTTPYQPGISFKGREDFVIGDDD